MGDILRFGSQDLFKNEDEDSTKDVDYTDEMVTALLKREDKQVKLFTLSYLFLGEFSTLGIFVVWGFSLFGDSPTLEIFPCFFGGTLIFKIS